MFRGILDNVLSGMKAGFKAILESPVKSISRDSPHVELSLFFSPRI